MNKMKKEHRLVYIELSSEIQGSLCTFCRHSEYVRDGCCEGYAECHHPLEALSYQAKHEEDLPPGGDCWGFKPTIPVSLAADLVGVIISQGYDEWFYRKYSPKSITVYGRSFDRGIEKSGKVRIG